MSDYLVNLANDKITANLVKSLGLPTPVRLRRRTRDDTPALMGLRVLCVGGKGGYASKAAAKALALAGAEVVTANTDAEAKFDAVVLDATGCTTPAEAHLLYDVLHPVMRSLTRNARLLVLASCPAAHVDPVAAAIARGIEGFVRTLAKEVGKRGGTANLLYVQRGAESRLAGPLGFFCAPFSAYVSGQALVLGESVRAPASMSEDLTGKVALVTGAARGIGASTAMRLAAAGAKVICLDVAPARDPLYELALRIGGTPLVLDIAEPGAAEQLAEFIGEKFGGIDLLVHNAGITRDKTLANMSAALWDQVVAVNLQAILAIDAVLDAHGLLRDEGREICLSSISGIAGNYGQSNYALTKAALIGYVAARAPLLAERGITINAVAPGFIETPMTQKIPVLMREAGRRLNSLSQGGLPEDVAEAVGFFLSPAAYGLTGQTLRVCGQALIGA